MKFKCPYCHSELPPPEAWKNAQCPACHKTILVEGGIADRKARADAHREALERIEKDAERARHAAPGGTSLMKRPPRFLFVGLVMLFVAGSLVLSRAKFERTPPEERVAMATRELHVLATALGLYRLHTGHLPTVSEKGIWALIEDTGTEGWRGPYITADPKDPWGQPYQYDFSVDPPRVFSKGPDRILDTQDDLHADPASFTPSQDDIEEWRPEAEFRYPSVLAL